MKSLGVYWNCGSEALGGLSIEKWSEKMENLIYSDNNKSPSDLLHDVIFPMNSLTIKTVHREAPIENFPILCITIDDEIPTELQISR